MTRIPIHPNPRVGAMLRGALLVALTATALAAAGCGDDNDTTTTTDQAQSGAASSTIAVTMNEFTVSAAPDTGKTGRITFDVTNEGKVAHEFIIAKSDLAPDALPTNEDGVVNEGGEGIDSIDEIEDIEPGKKASDSFELEAGKYVLFCNLPGHYKAGQTTGFTVE